MAAASVACTGGAWIDVAGPAVAAGDDPMAAEDGVAPTEAISSAPPSFSEAVAGVFVAGVVEAVCAPAAAAWAAAMLAAAVSPVVDPGAAPLSSVVLEPAVFAARDASVAVVLLAGVPVGGAAWTSAAWTRMRLAAAVSPLDPLEAAAATVAVAVLAAAAWADSGSWLAATDPAAVEARIVEATVTGWGLAGVAVAAVVAVMFVAERPADADGWVELGGEEGGWAVPFTCARVLAKPPSSRSVDDALAIAAAAGETDDEALRWARNAAEDIKCGSGNDWVAHAARGSSRSASSNPRAMWETPDQVTDYKNKNLQGAASLRPRAVKLAHWL